MATLLICYDGSEGAMNALAAAGRLFPGAAATILYAWKRPLPYGGIAYGGQIILPPEIQHDIDVKARADAEQMVAGAVQAAKAAGLDPTGEVRETSGPIWRQLLAAADDADADTIVAGSHGYGEVRALLLGSTSQALAHHAHRPLLIVPAPAPKRGGGTN